MTNIRRVLAAATIACALYAAFEFGRGSSAHPLSATVDRDESTAASVSPSFPVNAAPREVEEATTEAAETDDELSAEDLRSTLAAIRNREFTTAKSVPGDGPREARMKDALAKVLPSEGTIDELLCRNEICRIRITIMRHGPSNAQEWAHAIGSEMPNVDFAEIERSDSASLYVLYAAVSPAPRQL